MTDAKFKLEDILNKQKAPPQILDLVHTKIETEEDYKAVIEKIPDYRIKPERREDTIADIDPMKTRVLWTNLLHKHAALKQLTKEATNLQEQQQLLGNFEDPQSIYFRRRSAISARESCDEVDDTNQEEEAKAEIFPFPSSWEVNNAILIATRMVGRKRTHPAKMFRSLATSAAQDIELILAFEDEVSAGREGFPEENPKKADTAISVRKNSRKKEANNVKDVLESNRQSAGPVRSSVPEIPYQFADPCPSSMRDVNITDLSSVNINWKMLTLARPKTKTDEEIFSKLVQLDKLRLQTRAKEEEQALARGGKDPFIVVKNPSASKGGVAETSIKVCNECAEEFCGGTCKEFQYDSYQRLIIEEKEKDATVDTQAISAGKSKGKKKHRKKKKEEKNLARMPINF